MVALTVVGMDLRDIVEEGLAGELDMGSEGRGKLFLQVCSQQVAERKVKPSSALPLLYTFDRCC